LQQALLKVIVVSGVLAGCNTTAEQPKTAPLASVAPTPQSPRAISSKAGISDEQIALIVEVSFAEGAVRGCPRIFRIKPQLVSVHRRGLAISSDLLGFDNTERRILELQNKFLSDSNTCAHAAVNFFRGKLTNRFMELMPEAAEILNEPVRERQQPSPNSRPEARPLVGTPV
jgi:hypothetical protein